MPSTTYEFATDERPSMPGSPFATHQVGGRRVAYALVGALSGVCATFPNALTNVNVTNIAGSLGLYVAQASWLPAIYFAMCASANLILVKSRIQFGIPAVTCTLLTTYAAAGLLQFALPSFAAAVAIRAVDGLTAACLISLGVYYWSQVFPGRLRPLALLTGISIPQMGTPLARLIPVEMLATDRWRGLHLIELGVPLAMLAAIIALPLPPSERGKAFQPLDLMTIALVVPAMLLTCGVLGLGRVLWWTDTPWLGWLLVAAVPLFTAAVLIEAHREHPLLQLRWLGRRDILRFAAIALLVRLALAEQTFGSVGLLTTGGLWNDQLRGLFAGVALAMVFGIVLAALTLSERNIPYQVMAAAVLIAIGATLDGQATVLTRPPQLYLSQALIGLGTTLYVGPAMLYGFRRMFAQGPDHMISFVVLLSMTQNVGALLGSAIMGSYQIIRTHAHALALSEHLVASDPLVVLRLGSGSAAVAGSVTDPLFRGAEGSALLNQSMTQQANILAFNDVFRGLALLALASAAYVGYLQLRAVLGRSGHRPQPA